MNTATPSLAERAAALDVLLVDADGPVRRFVPDMSTAKWAVSLARKPDITARRLDERGGARRPAPEALGSNRLSVLAEAPGTYVFDR